MTKIYRLSLPTTALSLLLHFTGLAQDAVPPPAPPAKDNSEVAAPAPPADDVIANDPAIAPMPPVISDDQGEGVLIRPKGKKDAKITIEIHGGDVRVNGKPISEFRDKNVSVSRYSPRNLNFTTTTDLSPFREDAMNQAMKQAELSRLQAELAGQQRDVELKVDRTLRAQNMMLAERDRKIKNMPRNDAYLGVSSRKSETDGAVVVDITSAGPAEKAGLKKGDVIIKVDKKDIHNPDELYRAIHDYKPADKVKVTFRRDGKEQTATATLEKSKDDLTYNYHYRIEPDVRTYSFRGPGITRDEDDRPKLGLKAQDAEDGKGVNVMDVVAGSAADKAGLKKGDVILRFDGDEVNDAEDLAEKVDDARSKINVSVSVLRDGKNQDLELHIPRKLKSAEL